MLTLEAHFIEGTTGERWLTSYGVQYVTEVLKQRTPISLNAEKVLRFLIEEFKDNQFLTQGEIINGVNISLQEYRQAYQQLVDFDFVKTFGSGESPALTPTKHGRQAVHLNFQRTTASPNIQAGAIFTGPVTGSNIQAIASAINSEIQQNVSSLSSEEIQEKVQQTLKELLGQIEEHLSLQQKAAYAQLAAEFQKETTQPKPDEGKLHKLLAGLGLLSDLSGTIDLGQKTFQLIAIASPYIMILDQIVVQLLKISAH
jgi:hypothetical protein